MLANLALDERVLREDVGEDCSKANLHQHLADRHLLAIGVLHLECVLCLWQHNDVGVVVESSHQQQPKLLANCGVPLLAFGKRPVNALLAGRQLPVLLNEECIHSGDGTLWHAKHWCVIMMAWRTHGLLRQGSAKGMHHLKRIAPIGSDIDAQLLCEAILHHQSCGLTADKYKRYAYC